MICNNYINNKRDIQTIYLFIDIYIIYMLAGNSSEKENTHSRGNNETRCYLL